MSTKLTEVATERFIDNISSITPGALRGGLQTVARHPSAMSSSSAARMACHRPIASCAKVQRRIGDNALCIRKWPAMEGRIYAVRFAPDGKSFAASSSLDGTGTVNFSTTRFRHRDAGRYPRYREQSGPHRGREEEGRRPFHERVKLLGSLPINAGVYTLSYQPDGKAVAAAGEDGKVRMISAPDGKVLKEFVPVPIGPGPLTTQTVKLDSK